MDVTAAMAPLEAGYAETLDELTAALRRDDAVRAVWLAGSVGRGCADAGSDLDLIVTVAEIGRFADASAWAVLDPVITVPIPGRAAGFAFTTRRGLRVDVVVEERSELAVTPYRERVPVFDRDGFSLPAPEAAAVPDPDLMTGWATEFLRQAAIFPAAVLAREDWLLGQVAVHNLAQLLYVVLAESNQPLPAMGVKQWSSRLTVEQRELLMGLPVPRADRSEVVAAMSEVRDAWLAAGQAALRGAAASWPVEAEQAVATYWRKHQLGWPLTAS